MLTWLLDFTLQRSQSHSPSGTSIPITKQLYNQVTKKTLSPPKINHLFLYSTQRIPITSFVNRNIASITKYNWILYDLEERRIRCWEKSINQHNTGGKKRGVMLKICASSIESGSEHTSHSSPSSSLELSDNAVICHN